jgi:hypothetical protein
MIDACVVQVIGWPESICDGIITDRSMSGRYGSVSNSDRSQGAGPYVPI